MKKVILFEIERQHTEVLYPQVIFFVESGYEVTLAVGQKTYSVDLIKSLENRVKFLIKGEGEHYLQYAIKVVKYAKQQEIRNIVMNTILSSKEMISANLFMGYFKNIAIVRHGINDLFESKGKKSFFKYKKFLMNRINKSKKIKNYVLSNSVYNVAVMNWIKNISFFYPIYFNGFFKSINIEETDKGKIKFGIPGGIYFNRRNYSSLISGIKKIPKEELAKISIHIIGDSTSTEGTLFRQSVIESGFENNFEFYTGFLSFEKLFTEISKMDFLMPLIDKDIPNYEKYNKYNITGTTSMALAFGKPMIVSKDFYLDEFHQSFSIEYDYGALENGIMKALKCKEEEYKKLKNNILSKQVDYNFQREKYMKYFEDN